MFVEQFKAGDMVECVEASARLVKGKIYLVARGNHDVGASGCPEWIEVMSDEINNHYAPPYDTIILEKARRFTMA